VSPNPVERSAPRAATPWIVMGFLATVGLVVAALLLRPAPPELADGQAQESASPVATDPALAGIGRVRLRAPGVLAPERRDSIVAALMSGGVARVEMEALAFTVETPRVGYYVALDRASAEALAQLVAPLLTPGRELPVRDYGKLVDEPEPGRLDLWVTD
jgi:hypothetical protein